MSFTYIISFEINCELHSDRGCNETMCQKHIKAINSSFKQNGRVNSNEQFISIELGEIILHKSKITNKDGHLLIEFDVTVNKPITDVTEVIWTIMPSCYSDDDDEKFEFDIGTKYMYWLTILDVPQNITYKLK